MMLKNPTLSIVIPALNEELNIPRLTERLVKAIGSIGSGTTYEIIFVDDGSSDQTVTAIKQEHLKNPNIKALSFSRNFGHQFALTAGMDFAAGDAVIVMDADMQHPPEMIAKLVEKWKEGFDLVLTERTATEDASLFKNLSAGCFYWLFRKISRVDLKPNTADFRLMDQKVIQALRGIRERSRFLRGLTAWVGYKTVTIPYRAEARQFGQTKYHFKKMLRFAADGIVSFSSKPLWIAIYPGIFFALLGFGYAIFAIVAFCMGIPVAKGWTSLVCLVSIIGGLQLMLLGAIGAYLGRVFDEVKQRPLYLVRETIGEFNVQPLQSLR